MLSLQTRTWLGTELKEQSRIRVGQRLPCNPQRHLEHCASNPHRWDLGVHCVKLGALRHRSSQPTCGSGLGRHEAQAEHAKARCGASPKKYSSLSLAVSSFVKPICARLSTGQNMIFGRFKSKTGCGSQPGRKPGYAGLSRVQQHH